MHVRIILKTLGTLLFIEVAMLVICAFISLGYGEHDLNAFLTTAGIAFVLGSLLYPAGADCEKILTRRDGYVIVSIAWVVLSAIGMLPFIFSGYVTNPASAFFETVSGFTTTGATILTNIDQLPHGLLFWRSLTNWVGGLGIIFFTIAILPIFGMGGVQLFAAESTGPSQRKLHPRISVATKEIILLYFSITVLQTILLSLGSMPIFDSICHSMSTLSTGGFSTRQGNIGSYHSRYIEYVTIVFMLLGGTNFSLLIFVCRKKWRKLLFDSEFKWFLGALALFTAIVAVSLIAKDSSHIEDSLRKALFQVTSTLTSTGFTSANYRLWPSLTWGIMILAMISGACSGSTSGGIKCIRLTVIYKVFHNEIMQILHPNAVLSVRINNQVIPQQVKTGILTFTLLYAGIAMVGTLVLMGMNIGITESISMVISSMGNDGPAFGATGVNGSWSYLPDAAKWVCSFLMLVGRLEIFPILLMFAPQFWKNK